MTGPLLLELAGCGVTLNPEVGNLRDLWFAAGGRRIAPLHTAPWVDEAATSGLDLFPVERTLSGDFLCAPFGSADDPAVPLHGWSANSGWSVREITRSGRAARAELVLMRDVQGARVTKEVHLVAGVPLLAQVHRIEGGQGGLTVAHHPNFRALSVPGTTTYISYSPKRLALTGNLPLEPGRSWLAPGARSVDLAAFPAAAGGTVDLHAYPALPAPGPGHEDFITLIEAKESTLGWTALIREAEDDLIFVLKDPAVLPVTMLWFSNGGRDYAPWNGRHTGVLGIEDGIAAGGAGLRAAQGANSVSDGGVPTVLDLAEGRDHVIRHVIGAVPRPAGWTRIADIAVTGTGLSLRERSGATIHLAAPRDMLPI